MTDGPGNSNDKAQGAKRSLKQAVHIVKNRQAERDDVVVEMKAAEESRLELLADELSPLFDQIDADDERFQLSLTRGDRPRLWIDMTSSVAMGHDRRTYRFSKDARLGRFVLEESDKMETVADAVTQYVAERVLERERALEGEWVSLRSAANVASETKGDEPETQAKSWEFAPVSPTVPDAGIWRTLAAFLLGILLTLAVVAVSAYALLPGLIQAG